MANLPDISDSHKGCDCPGVGWCIHRERAKLEPHLSRLRWLTSAPPDHYTTFRRSPVSLNLAWVASAGEIGDPPLLGDLGATCYLVAISLQDDEGVARWYEERAPRPWVFNWTIVEPLMSPENHRAALGPGWTRRAKGQEVSLQEPLTEGHDLTLESVVPTPGLDFIAEIEARLELDAHLAQARLAPREAEVVAWLLERGGPEYGVLADLNRERGWRAGTAGGYWADAKEKLRRAVPA